MKRQEILINNIKISYIKEEDTTKKNVLFLHGFQSSLNSFLPLIKEKHNFNMIAFDFPAHGESQNVIITMQQLIDITNKFIELVVKSQEIVIVGHSMGGHVALMIEQVKNKVLLAPHSAYIFDELDPKDLLKLISPQTLDEAVNSIIKFVAPSFKNDLYFKNVKKTGQTFFNHYQSKKSFYEHIIHDHLTKPKAAWQHLEKIRAFNHNEFKYVFVAGDKDHFVPTSATKKLANILNGQYIELAHTGHLLIFERKQKIKAIIENAILNC